MVKIALKGYTRSGKDTVGQIMKDYLFENGLGVTRMMAFGDELRKRFHMTFPNVPRNPKPRELYEKFGQLGRDIEEDFWVNSVAETMRLSREVNYKHFIITDLRQPNEAKWCRDNGFKIIEVWAPERYRKERSNQDTEFKPMNESEFHLHEIEYDYFITNMFTMHDLKDQTVKILQEVLQCENNS